MNQTAHRKSLSLSGLFHLFIYKQSLKTAPILVYRPGPFCPASENTHPLSRPIILDMENSSSFLLAKRSWKETHPGAFLLTWSRSFGFTRSLGWIWQLSHTPGHTCPPGHTGACRIPHLVGMYHLSTWEPSAWSQPAPQLLWSCHSSLPRSGPPLVPSLTSGVSILINKTLAFYSFSCLAWP